MTRDSIITMVGEPHFVDNEAKEGGERQRRRVPTVYRVHFTMGSSTPELVLRCQDLDVFWKMPSC